MKSVRVGIKAGCTDRSLTLWQRKEAGRQAASFVRIPRMLLVETLLGSFVKKGTRGKPEEAAEGYTCETNTGKPTPVLPSFVLCRETIRFVGARLLQHLSYKDQIMFLIYFPNNKPKLVMHVGIVSPHTVSTQVQVPKWDVRIQVYCFLSQWLDSDFTFWQFRKCEESLEIEVWFDITLPYVGHYWWNGKSCLLEKE